MPPQPYRALRKSSASILASSSASQPEGVDVRLAGIKQHLCRLGQRPELAPVARRHCRCGRWTERPAVEVCSLNPGRHACSSVRAPNEPIPRHPLRTSSILPSSVAPATRVAGMLTATAAAAGKGSTQMRPPAWPERTRSSKNWRASSLLANLQAVSSQVSSQ